MFNLGQFLSHVLTRAGNAVKGAENGVANAVHGAEQSVANVVHPQQAVSTVNHLYNSVVNSQPAAEARNAYRSYLRVLPFYPSAAISAESQRPNTPALNPTAPYAINGAYQYPSWFVHTPTQSSTAPMPEALGQPDWSAGYQSKGANYRPDVGHAAPGTWTPQAEYIHPGITHPDYYDGSGNGKLPNMRI